MIMVFSLALGSITVMLFDFSKHSCQFSNWLFFVHTCFFGDYNQSIIVLKAYCKLLCLSLFIYRLTLTVLVPAGSTGELGVDRSVAFLLTP
jgi:hypothetical protein